VGVDESIDDIPALHRYSFLTPSSVTQNLHRIRGLQHHR
jgi:hypothetical protein